MKIISQHRALVALAAASCVAAVAQSDSALMAADWQWSPATTVVEAVPPLPPPTTYPVQLVLDDDISDGALGVASQTARQFLWFNRFSAAEGFHLQEVWVLFPSGANMAVGAAVQIAIYEDADNDPSNGANLIASFNETIQAADDNTFSIYAVPGAPTIPDGSDLLVGVVPRFIVSGVTSATLPAAIDTSATQSRSWLAAWSTDPPDPPVLVPIPDQTLSLVDDFLPGGGNFMIRAFGSPQGVTEIPTLGDFGLVALALALLAAAVLVIRRRKAGTALLSVLLLALAAPVGAVTIDTFTTNQAAVSDPPGTGSTVTGGADIIGTRRGMVPDLLTGAGPATASVAGGNLVLLVTATTPDSRGEVLVSWDGDTNPAVLSPTGLLNANLTTGNASGFRLDFVSTTIVTEIEITVYDDAANFSRAARRVAAGGAQIVTIPFAEFRVAGGTGAVFSSVGAIEMTVRSGEGTATLSEITTTAPTVAATKIDTQILDSDGDTRVDPGDRVRYTVTVTNSGNQALAVDVTDTVDSNTTLVPGSVSSTPVAHNDQYAWFGNVTFSTDGTATKPNLLANDQDGDGDTLTVQAGSFPATSAQGGTLTLDSAVTGAFTYSPPAGFSGVDSFSYTALDDNGNTAVATANIALDGVVWFIDDSNSTPPHLGTLADPFQTLASVNSGSDPDQAGDIIFVYDDDGTPYAGGLVLEADQTLLGEGEGLILAGTTIVPAGGRPQITNGAGIGLALATNNTLRGFDIQGTSGAGISGSSFGTLIATNVNVLATGGAALDLTSGALSSVVFGTLSSTGAGGQRGLNLVTLTGSLTATTTSLTNPTTDGILVSGSAGASFSFGGTTVTDNAIGSGATADGIDLATGNAGSTFNFASLALTTDGGTGLRASSSGTINVGGTGNSVVSTGGPAVDVTSTSFGSGVTFATLTSNNSTGKGVNLDTITGPFTASGGSINASAGACFDLNGGSSNVSYSGPISCTANALLVEITGRTGGTVTLSGNLSGTSNSNGINVASNTGGTINFSGSSKILNTAADPAVTLATNAGTTINFTGGGLTITTSSGTGFNATGGATAITVQGTVNTINATTGTALNVASTTIGALGLTFQSISAGSGGAASNVGISLVSTGALGGLTVTGNSTGLCGGAVTGISPGNFGTITPPVLADCTGGVIQNKNGTDGINTNGIGIFLSDTRNVSLTRMHLHDFQNFGIKGYNVVNFTMANCTVNGTNGTATSLPLPANAGEGSVYFGDYNAGLTGLTGTGSVTNSNLAGGRARNMSVINHSGTLNRLTITGTAFEHTANAAVAGTDIGNQALALEARTLGTILNATVTGSKFTGAPGDLANFTGQTATTMDVVFQSNAGSNNHPDNIIGGGGLTFATQGVMTFLCDSNNLSGANGSAVTLFKASAGTSFTGTFSSNRIGLAGVPASGSSGSGNGIFLSAGGTGAIRLAITNNEIRNYTGNFGISMDNTGGSYTVDLNMTGNLTAEPGAGAAGGLGLAAGSPSSADNVDVCANITGNDFVNGAPAGPDVYLGVSTGASSMRLPGLGSPVTEALVEGFVSGNNPGAEGVDAYVDAPATFAANFVGGAACPLP